MTPGAQRRNGKTWRGAIQRALLLTGGWWALVEGDPSGFAFGVPVIAAATLASLALGPPHAPNWRPLGLLRLAQFFLAGSIRGGVDVARRALSPRLPLAPGVVTYPMRLPPGPAQNLFMGMLSLMPGTLTADLDGHDLAVHVLVDGGETLRREFEALEQRVADAFGIDAAEPGDAHA